MNFYSIVIYGYFVVALLFVYFINRDRKKPELFFGKHKNISLITIAVLILGIAAAVDARFVEPRLLFTNEISLKMRQIKEPIKIAFITDLHMGENKKSEWAEKVVKKIEESKPDLVLMGGDFIVNYGAKEDETKYLEPLRKLVGKYPTYYVLGNHEYGTAFVLKTGKKKTYSDNSKEVIKKMNEMWIKLLKNELECLDIKGQKICLYGVDDIWGGKTDYSDLMKWNSNYPVILISHNPDAVLTWPEKLKKPDLVLAGHTHGGQIRLPFIGPLGEADVALGKKYYKGLNYWNDIPIFVTVGVSETGGPVRFLNPPEVAVITLDGSLPLH